MRFVLSIVIVAVIVCGGLPPVASADRVPENPRCVDDPRHHSKEPRKALQADASFVGTIHVPSHDTKHPGQVDKERKGHSFRLDQLGVLTIVVEWKNVTSPETQRLEVWTPTGNLYQSFTQEIAESRTQTILPVSGSWIDKHSMTGEWCVQVYVESHPDPITRESFTLHLPR